MNLVKTSICLIACYLFTAASGVDAADKKGSGRLLCWTNNEGVKECGDRIPPEYAQQEHQELNKKGMVIDKTEAVKSKEELAKEKEQAAATAEEERLAKEAARNDKILLQTFSNVDDIQMARDGKIATLQSSI